MPTDSSLSNESNGKRKVKNKAPKRLRRKNKPTDINKANNLVTTDHESLTKQKAVEDNPPSSPSKIDEDSTVASIEYWRNCTKKAWTILEKQASNRRKFFIERHQERIHAIQYLLTQREDLEKLTVENHSVRTSIESLRQELHTKDEAIKLLEDKLDDRDELLHANDFLRAQLKLMEQKFDRFTMEYSKQLEEHHRYEQDSTEQIQAHIDEIERIKRDLVLEEYRKQEAERKVRSYEEKMKIEQNLNKKCQQDVLQLKQELKSMHMRYDSLQIEMLAMHQANSNDISLIPTKDTNEEHEWTRKRAMEQEKDEQLESKRTKRKTRDRTKSSESNGKDESLPKVKRKTLKSKKTMKAHLPALAVTEASPCVDQVLSNEKDSTQLLLPSSTSAASCTSIDTSSDSQPLKPRTKKPSRYPCRRAQRPVKQIDTSNQVEQ